ncbi:uncharacterized protein LOC121726170 [Aricia agestis]|uniref:uncharacterized protein LOC121726170 n=1 Tax=Aricia agestis TaxID=91739 RepID=UPI001C20AF52|nr:uncharacterized protein LOC121726170 [Aricia agestis]
MTVESSCLLLAVLPALAMSALLPACEGPTARTETGQVCGTRGRSAGGAPFASFLNLPYARQPLAALRFAELQPAEPWDGYLDARTEGPVCPQGTDNYFTGLMRTTLMDEACIHAAVHAPLAALPGPGLRDPPRASTGGLPVLVFVHGGGFIYGAGHTDLYGPEYIIDRQVVVVTFNYRLGAHGFLSLNSGSIPGNNALRDAVTLLKWVRRNIRYFGGDPDNVTLAGESAGAAMTHLLALSKSAAGLFQRAVVMSGVATHSFFTASPSKAKSTADLLLKYLNINATDPEEIHGRLTELPWEDILEASLKVEADAGLVGFCPVVERPAPGFTTIIDEDPVRLLEKGQDKDIPLLITYTNAEAHFFRFDFERMDIVQRVKNDPLIPLPPDVVSKTTPSTALANARKVDARYFNGEPTVDKYIRCFSETALQFPSIKLAETRKDMGSPTFLLEFAYDADFSPIKVIKNITYEGTAHVEDLTILFRNNYIEDLPRFSPPTERDRAMRDKIVTYFTNFMSCSDPTCSSGAGSSAWPALRRGEPTQYLQVKDVPELKALDENQREMMRFFDDLIASEGHNVGLLKPYQLSFTFMTIFGVVTLVGRPGRASSLTHAAMLLHIMTLLGVAHLTTQRVITTAQGRINGIDMDGYTSYVGIPYASASSPSGRFKRAGPAPSWQGVRESHDPRCSLVSEVAQCLQLDVHVPSAGRSLPVLVWIKGGAGDYDPGALVKQEIIVVVVRHRLGAAGFLCSQTHNVPGNAGLKDALQALRWIRDNIVAFDGNPHKVVVGGQGFGAAMAEALVLSPPARGLLHGAIVQSGSVLAPWAFNYDADDRAAYLSSKLNDTDLTKVLVRTLAGAAEELDVPYLPFALCVEGSVKGEEKVIFEPPHSTLSDGRGSSVPLVIGYNSNEGYIFTRALRDAAILRTMRSDMNLLVPIELQRDTKDLPAIVNEIRGTYFPNNVTMEAVIKYHGDAYFTSHVHRSARLHAAAGGAPVYYYRFSHGGGGGGVAPEPGVPKRGAAHSDELAYLFPSAARLDDDDAIVQGRLIRLWTNFVKYLNPTPASTGGVTWEPTDGSRARLLDISTEAVMVDFPAEREARLWADLYDRYYARA